MDLGLGELSDESFEFKDITWKINTFFLAADIVDSKVQSRIFSLAGADWKIEIYPYGQKLESSESYIDFLIVRLNSRFQEHQIFYKIYLETRRGKEFESFSDSVYFNSRNDKMGVIKYLPKAMFRDLRSVITPNSTLTIRCQIRAKKIAGINKHSQTSSVVALLAVPVNKMIQDFKELFLKQEDCDVILKVKGREFPAHRNILKARSSVFASTFRNDMKEKATGVVDIEDCDPSSFSDFLCFLYCGNVENLSAEKVFSLFTAADKYDVQDLRYQCMKFMKSNLCVDTFCETITVALRHFEKQLIELAISFFAQHFQEIIVTVKWQTFVVENPIQSNEIFIKALVPIKK